MAYIILILFTIVFAVLYGNMAKIRLKSKEKQSILLFVFFTLYTITFGCRVGWGQDYKHYEYLYDNGQTLANFEFLFRIICHFFQQMRLNYHFLLSFISLSIIISYWYLIHDKAQIMSVALPLFVLFSAYQSTNLIRYFLAISLIYVALSFLIRRKIPIFLLLYTGGFFIHHGVILLLPFILVLYKWDLFSSLKKTYILYLISLIIGSISQYVTDNRINYIQKAIVYGLSYLSGESQLAKYSETDAIETVLLGTRWHSNYSIYFTIGYIVFSTGLIYLSFIIKKNLKDKDIFYNYFMQLSLLSVVIQNLTLQTEILSRIHLFFFYFCPIIIGYIYKYKPKSNNSRIALILMTIGILYIIRQEYNRLFDYFDVLYIWD